MNVAEMGRLVEEAVSRDPPRELRDYCGEQYEPYYHLLYLLALHTPPGRLCVELGVEKGRGSSGG